MDTERKTLSLVSVEETGFDSTPRLRAGVAKSDITTDEKGVKIRDRLYAKALVLDDDTTQVVIIAMDVTAIGSRRISQRILDDVGEEFLPRLRERIDKELGIPGRNVLVNASHTHSRGKMLCNDEEQIERTFDAVRCAMENMAEVKIGAGLGYEDRITINRTLRLKNGQRWTIRYAYPSPPDQEVADVGPVDPEIGVIRIDRLDGRPLAVVYNFACHPLFGDPQGSITANFPGVASRIIEESLGHGVIALFLQGAAGDIVDVWFKDFNRPRDIEPLGAMLALSTLKAWRNLKTTPNARLNVISEIIELPRRTDIPEHIAELQKEQAELLKSLRFTALNFKTFLSLYLRYALYPEHPLDNSYRYLQTEKRGSDEFRAMDDFNRRNIKRYLQNIYTMEKLAKIQDDIATLRKHQTINEEAGIPTISAEVQGIRIGDCVLITSPAELLVEVGLNIKRTSPYTFVVSCSNGYLHYGPPETEYSKGGYEATECLLALEWQKIYEQKALEIIRRLRES